jgi:hypothetical protein
MRLPLPLLKLLPLLSLLASCQTTAPSIDSQILAADNAVTAIVASTDTALVAKLITAAQAQSVSVIAHQVDPLLDAAKAASAVGNASSANASLTLVNTLLAGLSAYIPKAP